MAKQDQDDNGIAVDAVEYDGLVSNDRHKLEYLASVNGREYSDYATSLPLAVLRVRYTRDAGQVRCGSGPLAASTTPLD